MSKRRKIWWFGGSFVVLYSALAFFVSWNSPDAKLERDLQKIIAEYGLEYIGEMNGVQGGGWGLHPSKSDIFQGEPFSQQEQERVISSINAACPSCTSEEGSITTGLESTIDFYAWNPPEDSAISEISVIFNNKGLNDEDGKHWSALYVAHYTNVDRWSFLRSLWPW